MLKRKYMEVDQDKLKDINKDHLILIDMCNYFSRSHNLEKVLNEALSQVLINFSFDCGRIYLMDEGGKSLTLAVSKGIDVKGLEKIKINEGLTGKAARSGSFIAQHVSEMKSKKRRELLFSKGLRVIIATPLVSKNKVIGVMNLATRKIIEIEQENIDLLHIISHLIAVAINNAKLCEDIENKIEELEEKNDTIKFFAYSASHDLKNPAIGVYGLTKRLNDKYGDLLDEKGKKYCEQILKGAQHIVGLAENLNTYISAKETSLHLEKVNTKEIMKFIRNEFAAELTEKNIKWTVTNGLPVITADKISLIRVFQNFVDNSLKYGGEELSEIRIGYKEDTKFHTFSVTDDGIGLTNKSSKKIFQIFHRHETAKGTKGSGLGLSIVEEIAQRHDGKVWMESENGDGVTFYITIAKDLMKNNFIVNHN